jgi:hypothetical protein
MKLKLWMRILVALITVSILAVTLASGFIFQEYALANLTNDDTSITPNGAWTMAQVQIALEELGWPATTMAWLSYLRVLLSILTVIPVIFLLLLRAPGGWFGIYVAFVLAMIPALGGSFLQPLLAPYPDLKFIRQIIGGISWQSFFIMFFFFPNGRPAPRWIRWVAWAWIISIILDVPQLILGDPFSGQGFGNTLAQVENFLGFVFLFSALGSQLYRYFWVSNTVERQQTKLVVIVLMFLILSFGGIIPLVNQPLDPQQLGRELILALITWVFYNLSILLVPLAIGASILRYRLWDIDVIVRRTLQYSLVTGVLALVFFGSVTVLQSIFSAISGEQSSLAIALSTLAIAALFNPMRKRVQSFIDRRFYRQKYNAELALAQFTATARSEVQLETLANRLLEVVDASLKPKTTSLWIIPSPKRIKSEQWHSETHSHK